MGIGVRFLRPRRDYMSKIKKQAASAVHSWNHLTVF